MVITLEKAIEELRRLLTLVKLPPDTTLWVHETPVAGFRIDRTFDEPAVDVISLGDVVSRNHKVFDSGVADSVKRDIRERLMRVSDRDRLQIFAVFCKQCGRFDGDSPRGCQCSNDE